MIEHSDGGRSVTIKVRVLLVSFVLAATMWFAGCGHYVCGATFGNSSCSTSGGGTGSGGGTTISGGDYVYVTDPGGIQAIKFDAAAGTLAASSAITNLPAGAIPGSMVIAAEKYMYVSYPSSGDLYGWALAGDGTMQAINSGTPYSATYMESNTSVGTQSIIVNPAGTFLFSLDQASDKVHIYQISSGGALTELSPLALPSGFVPYNLATDGLGTYLYVNNTAGGITTEIAAYTIGSGTPTAVGGSPFSSNLAQMQGEPNGKYLIGTASTPSVLNSNIYVLSISGGAIAPVGSLATTYPPSTVAVQPANGGDLVYSFSTDSGGAGTSVEGFQLSSAGALTENTQSPFAVTGDSGQFEQTGAYLYVRDQFNKDMSVYAVSTGSAVLNNPTASVGWQTGEWAWAPSDVQ
jgi:hypothetical protein